MSITTKLIKKDALSQVQFNSAAAAAAAKKIKTAFPKYYIMW